MSDPLDIPNVWRAQSLTRARGDLSPTGFNALDEALGGGWPSSSLIELLVDVHGIGEVQLVIPWLLALVKRPPHPPLIMWVNPPHEPNAVTLMQHGIGAAQHWVQDHLSDSDGLWIIEQAVRSRACTAVLGWIKAASTADLRRLKLAVASSECVALLYRPASQSATPSPAHIRLMLTPRGDRLEVSIIKIQGRQCSQVLLDMRPRQHCPVEYAP